MAPRFLEWLAGLTKTLLFITFFRHYYQPPRRNAWRPYSHKIVKQPSALRHPTTPCKNWTRLVHKQATKPASRARVVINGLIDTVMNTFEWGEYEVSPDYLGWMRVYDPKTYRRITGADRLSAERYTIDWDHMREHDPETYRRIVAADPLHREPTGKESHGNAAMLASHGHLILPLCNDADLETQIIWAIRDFEFHYGRKPESAWLPEAAVSKRVLQMLSRYGIKRVILGAHQAAKFRPIKIDNQPNAGAERTPDTGHEWPDLDKNTGGWSEVDPHGDNLDDRHAYLVNLSPQPPMAVIFYREKVSHDMAFPPHLIKESPRLLAAMSAGLDAGLNTALISAVASDGEMCGHWIEHGEMGLAMLWWLACQRDAKVRPVNSGAFVALAPPTMEVEIRDNTSWSCIHGLDRWCRACGCGSEPHTHQDWRAPVRDAMDWLRNQAHEWFGSEQGGRRWFPDPWKARNAFIEVKLADGSEGAWAQFLATYCHKGLKKKQLQEARMAMEIMADLMSMYCSCGWFHHSMGLEMGQNLQYAYRAILQAKRLGPDWEGRFITLLEAAPCKEDGTAAAYWNKRIRPYGLQCELLSLMREFGSLPDVENLNRATHLADVMTTVNVLWWHLQDHLLKMYRKSRQQILADPDLEAGVKNLAEKLRLEYNVLEEVYGEWQANHDLAA
jgi:hypothetical protein